MSDELRARCRALKALVGNTPLLGIRCTWGGRAYTIHAKLETLNPTGSVKDRMALQILEEAIESGAIDEESTIVEATSGNTGIAFASLGRALGLAVRIYMPDWMSRERKQLMASFGADVVDITKDEGGFLGSIRRAREDGASDPHVFLPSQFENPANARAHSQGTGPEILRQLEDQGLRPTGFVAGVGTGGTVMGVAEVFRPMGATVHPLEPSNSPTLRTGHRVGAHRIQGISDEFIPELLRLDELDSIVDVDDGDAILMAQKLSSVLGLGLGISSGANFLGALQVAREQGEGAVVATVFADSNKKYLSTDLFREESIQSDHITPDVELLSFSARRHDPRG
ncbi:MAG TPA: PLP-dependent cysteine synthase family protein [Planctomycetes bacterium]|nr:PLP-dependent cysteine synthase family protein [Planctomycetota bacterium]